MARYTKKMFFSLNRASSTMKVRILSETRGVCRLKKIKRKLASFQKRMITLSELETVMKTSIHTYEDFAEGVLMLEEEKILTMVNTKGRTSRTPSLANQYRIDKSLLAGDYHKELQYYRNILHPSIHTDDYYGMDPLVWKKDLSYILKIDDYIRTSSFPSEKVPAPERSYELVGDEKWITEKGGKELLDRLGVFKMLNIIPVSDPLMFAINPSTLHEEKHVHLIVENKTTYQGLLPVLKETDFSTLIYGSGKKVIKSIEQFSMQYPINANHDFYYFGDIDREGISIWYSLHKKQSATPAIPFYQACLKKEAAKGKEYQKKHEESAIAFYKYFTVQEQAHMRELLEKGTYLPQETLKTEELQKIWRESTWKK